MSDYRVYVEKIHATDPRCKRIIHHDSRAWLYKHDTTGKTLQSWTHVRALPILDQLQVGSCTADCAEGILGTDPYISPTVTDLWIKTFGSWDQAGAYKFYNAEENLDGDGPFPPQDNGSSGLTSAKVARAAGLISGWTQTFSLTDALLAGQDRPLAVGTYWYNSMFDVPSTGVLKVDPSSGIAGGHEYEVLEYDHERGLVTMANSWGTGWGNVGYARIQAEDLGNLLAQQGDVTIYTPLTVVPPAPTDPLDVFAKTAVPWVNTWHTHIAHNAEMARATKTYLKATGRM